MNPTAPHKPSAARARSLRWGLAAAAALILAAVFALYQRPDFLVMLADQAWSCF